MVELREIRPSRAAPHSANPKPYTPSEIQTLWTTLDRRWPALSTDAAAQWIARWSHGRSPYSRIRRHAIRCQLDAIIGLALCCGMRPSETRRQQIDWIDPHNAYLVIWDEAGPWKGTPRRVPYSNAARALIGPWCRLHGVITPDNPHVWLNLSSATTMHEPLTQRTFDRLLRTYVGAGWTLRHLRDTYIVNQIRAGVPLEQLSVNVGVARAADLRAVRR